MKFSIKSYAIENCANERAMANTRFDVIVNKT